MKKSNTDRKLDRAVRDAKKMFAKMGIEVTEVLENSAISTGPSTLVADHTEVPKSARKPSLEELDRL